MMMSDAPPTPIDPELSGCGVSPRQHGLNSTSCPSKHGSLHMRHIFSCSACSWCEFILSRWMVSLSMSLSLVSMGGWMDR